MRKNSVKIACRAFSSEIEHIDAFLAETASLSDKNVSSYVRKLVTELSGGVFGYLDSVLERHSFDEFGELI